MFSQDYIMRQIQQMTQVLNAILTQVLKLKKQDQDAEVITVASEMLTEELGISFSELISLLESKGIGHLKKELGFTNEHLSILADIMYELAEQSFESSNQHEESLSYFARSLTLYEFIEKDERIYSIDRNVKMTKIRDYLN